MVQRPEKWARRNVGLNQLEQMNHSVKFRGWFSLFEFFRVNLRGGNDWMNLLKNRFWTAFQNRKRVAYLTWWNENFFKNDQKFDQILYFSCFWYTLPVCESSGCYVCDTLCAHLRAQYCVSYHICNSLTKLLGHSLTHCV